MSKLYGTFVTINPDGSTTSSKVKHYNTYEDMVGDKDPGLYAIVNETNQVYHRSGNQWVIGFPNVVRDDDYTAFEVLPHRTMLRKGTKLSTSILKDAQAVKDYLATLETDEERANAALDYNADPSMIHEFSLRSEQLPDEMDVIVDWGDGTIQKCSTDYYGVDDEVGGVLEGNPGDYRYRMRHEYSDEKVYTVKIYGKSYFGMIPNKKKLNLMVSLFSENLPVASHLTNFSSFCYGAYALVYVNLFNCGFNKQASNASNVFYYCVNLKKAVGFSGGYSNMKHCGGIFGNCYALQYTDLKLPATSVVCSHRDVFYRCWALATNVEDHFPSTGFISNNPISLLNTFTQCKAMKGTIPADLLWNNNKVSFVDTDNCFTDCSDEIFSQIPEGWGIKTS